MLKNFRAGVIGCLLMAGFSSVPAAQAAKTWVGGGSTPEINDATNWAGGSLPSLTNSSNNDVIFSGTATTNILMINAYVYNPVYRGTTFDASAGAFVFNSDSTPPSSGAVEYDYYFNWYGQNTVNNSPNPQTFNLEYLFFRQNKINAAAGDFVFNALLVVGGNTSNVISTNLDGDHDFYINTGFGGQETCTLAKNGLGTAYVAESLPNSSFQDPLNGGGPSDRWGGRLNVNNGNVELSNSFSLGAAGSGETLLGITEVRSAGQGFSDAARLTLTNNITTPETIFLAGRTSTANPHVVNKSGTNALSGVLIPEVDAVNNTVVFNANGNAAGDKLVVSGDLPQINSGFTAILALTGAGNGQITGTISQPNSTTILSIGALSDNVWSVAKSDDGVWTITSDQNYTGTTTVSAGKLIVDGSYTGGGAFTVDPGAILGGNSPNLTADMVVNGILAPGSSVGALTINGAIDLNGTLDIEYNSNSNTNDLVTISGSLDLSGSTLSFSDLGSGSLSLGPHVFATYGSLIGNPASQVGVPAGFMVDYAYGGNQIALVPVPEPSAILACGWLLAGMITIRRKLCRQAPQSLAEESD